MLVGVGVQTEKMDAKKRKLGCLPTCTAAQNRPRVGAARVRRAAGAPTHARVPHRGLRADSSHIRSRGGRASLPHN